VDQFRGAHRFREHRIDFRGRGEVGGPAGQDHDAGRGSEGAEGGDEGHAVGGARQTEVHDDERGLLGARQRQGLGAGGGAVDVMARLLENQRADLQLIGVILDKQ
jgi:hypothetical protein